MQEYERDLTPCFSSLFSYFGSMRQPILSTAFRLAAAMMLWNGLWAQGDAVTYQWPVPPFGTSRNINGTFCEYRNTLTANHFHNGVDIGEPDGYPVYSGLDGFVYSLSGSDGSNNYVRVRTSVSGSWKHISYVHINPAPGLAAGDPVQAGVTILGTIYPGMGHVHVTERELTSDVETNAIRNGGGLTPYVDTYTPVIDRSTLQYRQQGLGTIIPGSTLYGKVDISVRVNERNGPGNPGGTQTNNGTYMVGYRVWSADSLTIVFEPPDNGLRYRYDRKPLDSYVDMAFLGEPYSTTSAHYYYVTNGAGASAVSSSRVVSDSWFDTESLPEGSYVLEIFAEDTRSNTDHAFFPIEITRNDLVPPSTPELRTVVVDSLGSSIHLSWSPSPEPDLRGYRVSYRSTTGWSTIIDETVLTADSSSFDISDMSPFINRPGPGIEIRVTAVDTVMPPNESPPSDVYYAHGPSLALGDNPLSILIVDGFDRSTGSGSWTFPTHSFTVSYGTSLTGWTDCVSSCANEAVIDGTVNLLDYDAVIWYLGDESTTDETFSASEQVKVRAYLENGGRFLVSGSEVGWDLGRSGSSTASDIAFYNSYLKASFVYDGDNSMRTATGVNGSSIPGLTFTFGQVYPEDYPDDIDPIGGASTFMTYNTNRTGGNPRIAAIAYAGTFGGGTTPGNLAYLAFPFESILSQLQRETLMNAILQLFGLVSSVDVVHLDATIKDWDLSENYPNPFNPETVLDLSVPTDGEVSVKIFDMLGREVAVLLDEPVSVGRYTLRWNASHLASGVYYARLEAGSVVQTRKLMLVK